MKLDDTRGNVYYNKRMEEIIQPNGNPNATEENKPTGNDEEQPNAEKEKEELEKVKKENEELKKAKEEAEAKAQAEEVVNKELQQKLSNQEVKHKAEIDARDNRIKQLIHSSVEDKPTDTLSVAEELNKKRACKKW